MTNMQRLIIEYSATLTTQRADKSQSTLVGMLERIRDGGMQADLREATDWCKRAVAVVRQAAQPNPWVNSSDEEIAEEILRRLAQRKKRGVK